MGGAAVSAKSRQERARKRDRRKRRRDEADRKAAAAREVALRAREERLARLGPLVEMYGEGSELLRAADQALLARESVSLFAMPRHPMTRLEKRIYRHDGSVTLVHERFGFRTETTFAGGGWVKERK
jgi:hypothetical protein